MRIKCYVGKKLCEENCCADKNEGKNVMRVKILGRWKCYAGKNLDKKLNVGIHFPGSEKSNQVLRLHRKYECIIDG